GREIYDQRDRIVDATGVKPGLVVADIGAGSGLFTLEFAGRVGTRGTVYAVDVVKDFLTRIAVRAEAAGWRNVRTILASERSVELPPNSIDLAFICDTYHHFEYPAGTMASLHRALRRGGEVVVIDFRRIPGQSSDWILGHVRAGQETFEAEIVAAGFEKIEEQAFLRDNYFLRFRKVAR
ncbi:MAG: class I SAM-dependent methyltransferase, partial [Limisphaerales bacterium]